MKNGLLNQVSFAYKSWSSSSRSNSTDTAGSEAMDAGVIYVAAAGNNNQRLGIGAADPDRLNYMSDAYFGTTDPRAEFPAGTVPCNHRDWMNPQGIGFDSGSDFHPVICVGAMDEFILTDYKERKAYYSNNGPGIDLWAPADETIGATANGLNQNYQRWDDTRFYDRSFNGTSAAAPVAAGLIALYMESFPTSTSRDVKNWLNSHGTQQVGTDLYQDEYPDDTTTTYWTGQFNMRGASTRISYNPYTVTPPAPTPPVDEGDVLLGIQGGIEMSGITINSQ
jgi:subtilisin family serine protease